ncbi:DUF3606 domain-containing protein [Pedobacter rhizosphaerae]|uniref:DUF3606 domain-containing protein n=1 Tax=Pedobacter rhizosphaerae TaxID=390241 RepID=A0A1H9URL5_9SPHI|nr:DUF3606 domain-containing protein [Pedobacter rhizosphaerae]SES11981.1 Protein of unknown function [Pedobacter rhizosphaerae]
MNNFPSLPNKKSIIDLTDEKAQHYWAARLGTTIEGLKSAIRACQSMEAEEVQAYIQDSARTRKLWAADRAHLFG